MAKNRYQFFDDLEKDGDIYHKMVLKECAQIIRDKIVDEYKNLIEYFYNDYIPTEYSRVHGLRKSFKPYYRNNGKGVFSGGIVITSDNMNNDNYHDHKDYVLDMTVILGLHGTSDIWTTSPSPYEAIIQFRNSLNIEQVRAEAISIVDKKYRTFIKTQRGW